MTARAKFVRYLQVSGIGSVSFQVPEDCLLLSIGLNVSTSVAATVPGTGLGQVRISASTSAAASGINDVLVTIENTFMTANQSQTSAMVVYPNLRAAKGQIITLYSISPTAGANYSDAVFYFGSGG